MSKAACLVLTPNVTRQQKCMGHRAKNVRHHFTFHIVCTLVGHVWPLCVILHCFLFCFITFADV